MHGELFGGYRNHATEHIITQKELHQDDLIESIYISGKKWAENFSSRIKLLNENSSEEKVRKFPHSNSKFSNFP